MKRRIQAALLLAMAVLCIAQGSENDKNEGKLRKPEKPKTGHVSVLTYNVNYSMPRAQEAIKTILQSGADIVFLQETNKRWEKLLSGGLKKKYPHNLFRHPSGKHRAGGQAVFSKHKISELKYVASPIGWFPAWVVEIDSSVGKIQVLALHLKPLSTKKGIPDVSDLKALMKDHLKEIKKFYQELKSSLPVLVLGDFNEGDSGETIKWLKEKSFTDALAEFDGNTPTWRWKYRGVPVQERLDHILYSNNLHCYEAKVITRGGSDHYPVWAGIEKKNPAPKKDK